jgi:hypothetical protein
MTMVRNATVIHPLWVKQSGIGAWWPNSSSTFRDKCSSVKMFLGRIVKRTERAGRPVTKEKCSNLTRTYDMCHIRFTYIRSKDKRSKDKRSKDKRSKDKRSNWTQGRIGTQHRMTEGRMTEGWKGLKVERPNTEFKRRKTEGRKSFVQFLKLY